MVGHEARVETRLRPRGQQPQFQAVCSCGFRGVLWTRPHAEAEAAVHAAANQEVGCPATEPGERVWPNRTAQ